MFGRCHKKENRRSSYLADWGKKLMGRITETVFSLRFAWLGYESRPKIRLGILCQPLPYPLASFSNKMRENKFFMRLFEVLYEKVLFQGNITQAKQNFIVLNISARQFPRKWTLKKIMKW